MGRKNRRTAYTPVHDVTRLAHGGARVETRRGSSWNVRDISSQQSEKTYRCPGCELDVTAGQAHLVAWPAEHLFGDDAGVRERRHWHTHCWRVF